MVKLVSLFVFSLVCVVAFISALCAGDIVIAAAVGGVWFLWFTAFVICKGTDYD